MSTKSEIILNLYLNKSLTYNFHTPEQYFHIDKSRRNNFLKNLNQIDDKFFNVLIFMVKEQIPPIYLESFTELDKSLEKLEWPQNPEKIFTANAYEFDEYFKIYSAKKLLMEVNL